MGAKKKTIDDRIEGLSTVNPETGCWDWHGSKFGDGYPRMNMQENGKQVGRRGHRLSFQHYNGPLIDGLVIAHKCDNKLCVNPEHLEQITSRQNLQDSHVRILKWKGERHPRAKLTNQQARDIRSQSFEGCRNKDLAAFYGVPNKVISRIITGETYQSSI